MQHDPFDTSTGSQRSDDVAQFVNSHHCEPAERQERGEEYQLVKTLHSDKTRITQRKIFTIPLLPEAKKRRNSQQFTS